MRFRLGIAALVALVSLTGCATLTQTSEQNVASVGIAADNDARQLANDWNVLWLADRPSRLTRWHQR